MAARQVDASSLRALQINGQCALAQSTINPHEDVNKDNATAATSASGKARQQHDKGLMALLAATHHNISNSTVAPGIKRAHQEG
jgi:mannose-1-phosphate guanylyltransferase